MIKNLQQWFTSYGIGKGVVTIFIIFVCLSTWLTIDLTKRYYYMNHTINEETVEIYLYKPMYLSSVALELKHKGVIKDYENFLMKVGMNTNWDVSQKLLKEGYYQIPPKIHINDLIKILDGQMNYRSD